MPLDARLIVDGPCEPWWNMALDEALARHADQRPTLRLYGWNQPTLSLGVTQGLEDVRELRRAHPNLALVRRPTGGGAIIHDQELTYSLMARYDAFGARRRSHPRELYQLVHRGLLQALTSLGAETTPAPESAPSKEDPQSPAACGDGPRRCAPLCFDRHTQYDLVIPGLGKLVGSAQRRYRQGFLQHGSLPLAVGTTGLGQGATTLQQVLGRTPDFTEVAKAVATALANELSLNLVSSESPEPAELALALDLRQQVYSAETWTLRT